MDAHAYIDHLEHDGRRLADAASGNLEAPVPACPGWDVRTLVNHTGQVFGQKAMTLRGGLAEPPEGPRPPAGTELLAWYGEQLDDVLTELRRTPPEQPTWTWFPPDQTAAFWHRRMAQEAVVHRVDAEAATGRIGPVDDELASDGVDEIITVMLVPGSVGEDVGGSGGAVAVETGGRRWVLTLQPDRVTLDDAGPADASISGAPRDVLLWLWGRLPDEAVSIGGPPAVVAALRKELALSTQ